MKMHLLLSSITAFLQPSRRGHGGLEDIDGQRHGCGVMELTKILDDLMAHGRRMSLEQRIKDSHVMRRLNGGGEEEEQEEEEDDDDDNDNNYDERLRF